MHLSIPPVVEDGPRSRRSRVPSSPRGGQLFKRGRRGGRERPKNPKAKRDETRRDESVAKRWEVESGRWGGEEGARRQNEEFCDWQRRTGGSTGAPRGDRFESVRGIGRRERRRGRGRGKRRRKKREKRKKMKKKKEKEKGAHTTTRWVRTRRMRAIPWRSIRLSYPIPLPLDFLPIY